jgi:hypothetical protein
MAKKILLDAYISINSVVLSNRSNKVTVSSSKDEVDLTAFGASSKQKGLGLGDGSIAVELFQDFDAGSVDATLWPLHTAGTEFPVIVRASSAAVSATNPEYRMTGVLPEYTPLDGSVGEASKVSISVKNSGDSGIVRATS